MVVEDVKMDFDIPVVDKARIFATAAHHAAGNLRKYTGEPYINHPAAVVEIVRSVPHTAEMLAAAWLHDVLEDTGVTLDLIYCEFGDDIAEMVEMLTDVSHAHDGLRAHRKAKDREHTARASPAAKTIKLADLIDNARSIVAHDPKFAKVYMAEKALLLDVLREGNPGLHAFASAVVAEFNARPSPSSWLDSLQPAHTHAQFAVSPFAR